MHLAANAIGHRSAEFAGTGGAALVHFIDEQLSHYLWHAGIVGLSWLLLQRAGRNSHTDRRGGADLAVAAGIIYGATYFAAIVEAGTAPLGVPFAVLVAGWVMVRGRRRLGRQPLVTFLFAAHAFALLSFLGWALYWRGLPEFSAVGIID